MNEKKLKKEKEKKGRTIDDMSERKSTGLPSSVCVVGCAFNRWPCRFIKLAELNPKFWSFKTEENEIKTHKIAVMVF